VAPVLVDVLLDRAAVGEDVEVADDLRRDE
jgi:hypothetical protein